MALQSCRKRSNNEKVHFANRSSTVVGSICSPRADDAGSSPNTSMVVLWFPQGVVAQIPGNVPAAGTAGWTQYQSCLQQNLNVSPQQSAQIAPILADEGPKVIAIRNNNSLSDAQKIQEVKILQKQSDPQLKAILSPAQYDKLKVVRYQALRWVTQKRLGWQ